MKTKETKGVLDWAVAVKQSCCELWAVKKLL
jgi:hypothetical protein